MLEKPAIADARLSAVVQADFGIELEGVTFLPLGADVNTAVYRGAAVDGSMLFIKLRRGDDSGLSAQIPYALAEQGIAEVIAPIETTDGRLGAQLDDFQVILTPYVNGIDGFGRALTDENWTILGRALRGIHETQLPAALRARLPREDFSDEWRALVRVFQSQAESGDLPDAVAEQMAAIMRAQQALVSELLDHAQRFGDELRGRTLAYVPCHADIHAGNVLMDERDRLYVVDWDTFMLAPKERDLMFIGAGIGDDWRGEQPARLFYAGYGPAEVDQTLIAYYRCERIIQDFAAFGEYLQSDEGGADRAQALHYFASNFDAGSTIDIALEAVAKARR
jgi:spectinomycin phosphotransferase